MASMERKRGQGRDKGPVSLEAERRRVMITVHSVEKELFEFWEVWIKNARLSHLDAILDCSFRVYQRMNIKRPAKDALEFESFLAQCQHDSEFTDRLEIQQLKTVCERSRGFDEILSRSLFRLRRAVEDHLAKYCLSFVSEIDDMELASVLEYENNISKWREEIKQSLTVVEKISSERHDIADNFTTYLEKYRKVLMLMQRTCEAFQPAFDPIKNWVMADENYPRKLQDEISRLSKQKTDFQEANRRLSRNVGSIKSKVVRRQYQTVQIQGHLEELLEERRRYRTREMNMREYLAKTETDFDRKRRELKDVNAKIQKYRSSAPHNTLQLWGDLSEQLRRDTITLEHKIETMDAQIRELQTDRYHVQKQIHAIQKDLDGSVRKSQHVSENMAAQEHGVKLTLDSLKSLNAKIEALRKIREIKLHSDTVKKIHFYGYSPGGKLNMTDPLEEAFKVTASEIGKEWSLLYQRLPFKPDRDIVMRARDIETIDISSRRLDADFATLSLKSLDKWRRLSDFASVNALVEALRRIRKERVAQKVERTLMSLA